MDLQALYEGVPYVLEQANGKISTCLKLYHVEAWAAWLHPFIDVLTFVLPEDLDFFF